MDKIQLNLSFHNLSSMVENLTIFHKPHNRYSIVAPLKVNDKRAIYLVKDKRQSRAAGENIFKVIKFILQVNATDEQLRIYRFYESVDHPNFCKIESIEEVDRFIMIVQEHIDGLTLLEYFQTELNKAQKYRALFDLIFALDYIHEFSVVHGDIQPDNIIVRTSDHERYGTPVIIDFDLGKDLSHTGIRSAKRPFGTTLYMSPEMINNQFFDYKTDIWSLGMTLYSCIIPSRVIQYDLHHVSQCENTVSPKSPIRQIPKSPSYTSTLQLTSPKRSSVSNSPDKYRNGSLKRTKTQARISKSSQSSKSSKSDKSSSMTRNSSFQSNGVDCSPIRDDRVSRRYSQTDYSSMHGVTSPSREIVRTIGLSTAFIGNIYDFDHMVHQLDKNKHYIQMEYGSLFFNTIRVMLLKDYRRRPSAHKLKDVMIRSKYYSKLYPKNEPARIITFADDQVNDSLSSDSDTYSADLFDKSAHNDDLDGIDDNEGETVPNIVIGNQNQATDVDTCTDSEEIAEQMRTAISNPDIPNQKKKLKRKSSRLSKSMTNIGVESDDDMDRVEDNTKRKAKSKSKSRSRERNTKAKKRSMSRSHSTKRKSRRHLNTEHDDDDS
jgi:serine/threonine protein kinase